MNPQNFEHSRSRSILSRIIAPIFVVIAAGLVYAVVVYDKINVIAISLGIALVLLLAYSRITSFRALLMEGFHKDSKILIAIAILLAIVVPLTLRSQPYIIHILVIAGISIILGLGLNFQVGSTGIPNLGYAAL